MGHISVALNAVGPLVRADIKTDMMKVSFDSYLFKDPVAEVVLYPLVSFKNYFFKGCLLRFLGLFLFDL